MANSSNRGFSLVELMIAIAVGVVISGSLIVFTMASMKSNSDYVQSTRLTQELRNTLDLATRDLRRAGYDDNALAYLGNSNTSPFAPIRIESGGSSACVLYAYDRTALGGTQGVLDEGNGEMRGLRRMTATVNGRVIGVLEYAISTTEDVKPLCNDAPLNYANFPVACVGDWCALSDSRNLDISSFTVVSNNSDLGTVGTGQMRIRSLDVAIAGRLSSSNEFLRRVQTRVKVQADCALSTFGNCDNVSP